MIEAQRVDSTNRLQAESLMIRNIKSQTLLDDIDHLFNQLPNTIKQAVFALKSQPQDGGCEDELKDEFEMDFDEGKVSSPGMKSAKGRDELSLLNDDVIIKQEQRRSTGKISVNKGIAVEGGQFPGSLDGEGLDATNLYLREIGHTPLLTPEEEVHYARLAVLGDPAGTKRMIESNLRLVVKISRRYLNRGLPLLDLVQEGNLGLMHAVGKFDPEKGFRFSTYATWWIRQTIERALMSQVRTIRVPIHVMKELNQCLRAQRELSAKLQHEPTDQEVANLLGRPMEEVSKLLKLNERITSLDISIGEDGSLQLADVVSNEQEDNPQELLCNDDMADYLSSWLDHLSDKHRDIIARRFGLDGYEKKTLQKVGEDVGLTRERVRQIQVEALAKLRRLLEQNGINRDVACMA